MARAGAETIGFVCAWIDHDDDPLLREDARQHAYISDIFVAESWRRNGVARALLQAVEDSMRDRGCERMRIRAKATNVVALTCYQAAGFNAYEVVFSKSIAATT
jgi:ribosomal protein S18 acetylase RimI-like enzyme